MLKATPFRIKGMNRDTAVSLFNPEFAYENKNIRILPTNENTLLNITNERGNKDLYIKDIGEYIDGVPIGQSFIDNEIILFTVGDKKYEVPNINFNPSGLNVKNINSNSFTISNILSAENDSIYKLWFDKSDELVGKKIFSGTLNFNYKYPIETISFYENPDIKKVYWTDGLNPPRVINIAAADNINNKWDSDSFNFVRTLNLKEDIRITKNNSDSGMFSPGTIQYVFTYFDKYGQESNIFYTSPLYYIAYKDRGGSPEDRINNSFTISINNIDSRFDYVRIYSIHRTSIDAVAAVKKVANLSTSNNNIIYVDSGTTGEAVDPTSLLFVGGEEVVFGTMTHKDNTLFLGNIQKKVTTVDKTIRDYFWGKDIVFTTDVKSIDPDSLGGYYSHYNQLNLNSQQIKTFKYLEHYRFGVQFQHYTGKWSEPIWVNDKQNDKHIDTTFYSDNKISLPVATFTIEDISLLKKILSYGFVKIRPVIVYPSINDRECICQGVLCPTVYNMSDRFSNSPFVQSSWFTRPNAPFDIEKAKNNFTEFEDSSNISLYSKGGVLSNDKSSQTTSSGTVNIDPINKGAWAEFRHNYHLPKNDQRNAEIQCTDSTSSPVIQEDVNYTSLPEYVSKWSSSYFIDQSIVTLHSPDIEFNDSIKNMSTSELKLRIVGVVPITSFVSDIDIQASTSVNNFKGKSTLPMGFYKEPIGVENGFKSVTSEGFKYGDSHFGWRSLISGVFWLDEIANSNKDNPDNLSTGFVVYPWHRNGSLNNTKYAKDGYKSAMLDKKRLSNLRYSYKTQYININHIWYAYDEENSNIKTGISDVAIFNSNEVSLTRLTAPKNSGLTNINYYGNIDKLITYTNKSSYKDGYYIMTSGARHSALNELHDIFTDKYEIIHPTITEDNTGTDPIRMKYKSTPHAIIALNYTSDHEQRVLPTIYDNDYSINNVNKSFLETEHLFWDKNRIVTGVSQDTISSDTIGSSGDISGDLSSLGGLQYGWLWLGELYNDKVNNRFGGTTPEAFENNSWLPCGEAVLLRNEDGSIKNNLVIKWSEGDTYYQRYDHIKTYPFTLEDQNQITDIISFMCETRVNIDGRYDRNRGQLSNFAITPANFNQVNEVYSQANNFFSYRGLNYNKINLNNFNNSITWTKTKTIGELIDTWTNITLASSLDLDGDKGPVRALKRFNNNIIAFQDRGISQILYNENMQVTTTAGVPIEIANSGKVQGKRYISDRIGCSNKWSICETSSGIYFIDNITKSIYNLTEQLTNISDSLGFHSWINNALKSDEDWNPVDFNNFVTYYDKINKDIFFINKDSCLSYSELLANFVSFYSYENTPYFINIKDKYLSFKPKYNESLYKVWLQNKGDYNIFFGSYQPFYTTIIANKDPNTDKVFSNIEFRSDSWNEDNQLVNETFDTLEVWNEYQHGISSLVNTPNRPSTLKRKFRMWRANIPRSDVNNRDRIRNPWVFIKLSKEEENKNKTILHDMIVYYIE